MYRRLKLAVAALALTTCAAHAQTWTAGAQITGPAAADAIQRGTVYTVIQPIQQTDPTDRTIQQKQQFEAMDAWSKHMEDSYYASLKRSNAHMACVVNSWHPENCD